MELKRYHKQMPWNKPKPEPYRNRVQDVEKQTFYNSTAWRRLSRAYLTKQHYLCEVCAAFGTIKPAALTDHPIPIGHGGAMLDERNLMSMCAYHHNKKSGLETNRPIVQTKQTSEGLIPIDRSEVFKRLMSDTAPKQNNR